jgi:N-acetyl sugar amidotransferase
MAIITQSNTDISWDRSSPASLPPGPYRICTRCVMDTTDPNISFDQDGVCNHCHGYDNLVRTSILAVPEAQQRLKTIVEAIRSEGARKPYDCIIGVSGGVDSTFVAQKVKRIGLRPLAVHLDNGWNSEAAVSNIAKVLSKLNIDLHTHVIDWEEFKDIQKAFLLASTPDAEIPSDHAIFAILYDQASRLGIRYVITGINIRTETHLPTAWSQGHWDWGYIRAVHRQFGTGHIKTFPHFNFYNYVTGNRHSHVTLNLLDLLGYSKKKAIVSLEREFGWKDYGGKHNESIYTRWFQGYYLPRKFGFDKRRSHLSSRLCSGELTRSEALAELQSPPYSPELQAADCEYVAKKLGFSAAEFKAIMDAPLRTFEEFPSYARFVQGKAFQNALKVWQFFKYRLLRGKLRA